MSSDVQRSVHVMTMSGARVELNFDQSCGELPLHMAVYAKNQERGRAVWEGINESWLSVNDIDNMVAGLKQFKEMVFTGLKGVHEDDPT